MEKINGGQRLNSLRMRSSACSVIGKMAALSGPGTHPSVHVQSGCRTLLTKICFTLLSVTFAELFLHLSEEGDRVDELCVYKVMIADRPGNGGGTDVDLTAPVIVCMYVYMFFYCVCVCIYVYVCTCLTSSGVFL